MNKNKRKIIDEYHFGVFFGVLITSIFSVMISSIPREKLIIGIIGIPVALMQLYLSLKQNLKTNALHNKNMEGEKQE